MLPPFSIVIPCFNEAARIGKTLRITLDYLASAAPESELIVVNDGSTDTTASITREVFSNTKIATRLMENFPNRGKGAAVRSGLLAAQKPIGLFSDADLSTPLGETPKLIEPIANGEIDVAFGSRAIDRSLIGNISPGGANRLAGFSIFLSVSPLASHFGTRNAVSRRFASTFVVRLSKPLASTVSPSMSSCFISRSAPDCASAKFLSAGTTRREAKSVSFTTACGCCVK